MLYLFLLVAALVVVGLFLNLRQSRAERRRVLEQAVAGVAEAQARLATRVIDLFDQVEQARGGSGRTAAAFAAVERSFRRASAAYDQACQQAEQVRELAAGGTPAQVRQAAREAERSFEAVTPLLDQLAADLAAFHRQWEMAPDRLAGVRERLRRVQGELAAVAAELGQRLPLSAQAQRMAAFLEQAEAELKGGNPVGALQKAEDLEISLENLTADLQTYRSAATALQQARDDLESLAATPAPGRAGADPLLEQGRRLLQSLAEHLAADRLDRFQTDLLALQELLRQARRTLRGQGGPAGVP